MSIEDRLSALEQDMQNELQAGAERMEKIETNLKTNTDATTRVEANTKELVEFFNSVQGAFRVLEALGKLAKPLAYITMLAGACTGLWLALKNGGKVHE